MVLPICQEETMMDHGQASPLGYAIQPGFVHHQNNCVIASTLHEHSGLNKFDYGHNY